MMDDDITDTLAPKSEQLDNIELLSGPRIFTVESVTVKKNAEQPVSVYLVGFPRPWKPGTNQRRVLAFCWGAKSSKWAGRRVKLFRDPDVTYGKDKPGGTRIAALSHIDGPMSVPLIISQGRTAFYLVEPLTDEAPAMEQPQAITEPTPEQIDSSTDTDDLRDLYRAARTDETRALIKARVAALEAQAGEPQGQLIPGGGPDAA